MVVAFPALLSYSVEKTWSQSCASARKSLVSLRPKCALR